MFFHSGKNILFIDMRNRLFVKKWQLWIICLMQESIVCWQTNQKWGIRDWRSVQVYSLFWFRSSYSALKTSKLTYAFILFDLITRYFLSNVDDATWSTIFSLKAFERWIHSIFIHQSPIWPLQKPVAITRSVAYQKTCCDHNFVVVIHLIEQMLPTEIWGLNWQFLFTVNCVEGRPGKTPL